MQRKSKNSTVKKISTVLIVYSLWGLVLPLESEAEKLPNILYIMADDQRYDTLSCNGNQVLQTPNIDFLAERGTSFRQAFATTPICCVSRVSVLTGQYARRHGVNNFFTQVPDLEKTYPSILQKKGYYTGFIGKWGTDEQNILTRFLLFLIFGADRWVNQIFGTNAIAIS